MKIDDKDTIILILNELARKKIIRRDTFSLFDYVTNNHKADISDIPSKNKIIVEPYGYECCVEKAQIIAGEMKKYGLDAKAERGVVIIHYDENYNKEKLDEYRIKVKYNIRNILGI